MISRLGESFEEGLGDGIANEIGTKLDGVIKVAGSESRPIVPKIIDTPSKLSGKTKASRGRN